MKIQKIGGRAVMFTITTLEKWTVNSYLIEGKSCNYIIDTGCGSIDGEALKRYHTENYGTKDIVIINTHFHFDHVWGNGVFADCPIIGHSLCERIMLEKNKEAEEEFADCINGNVSLVTPNIMFDSELYLNRDGLYLFHSRGHSPDGICIYDKNEKILYAGDNIGDTVDEPLPQLMETSWMYREAVAKMKSLDFKLLLSGHNEVLEKSFLDKIFTALDEKQH